MIQVWGRTIWITTTLSRELCTLQLSFCCGKVASQWHIYDLFGWQWREHAVAGASCGLKSIPVARHINTHHADIHADDNIQYSVMNCMGFHYSER